MAAKKGGRPEPIAPEKRQDNMGMPPTMKSDRIIGRQACVSALKEFASMSDDFTVLLQLPDKLYLLGNEETPSFSSQPNRSAEGVAGAMLFGYPFPKELPDYAIHISSKGSNIFCTMVDRSRKIIVSEPIRNIQDEKGDWGTFEATLRKALLKSESFKADGRTFSFVVEGDLSFVLD